MAAEGMVAMADGPADRGRALDARHLHLWLTLLLLAVCIVSLGTGASRVSLATLLDALSGAQPLSRGQEIILWSIRLPRLLLGLCVGAALAVSGVVLQGLFRNPLADPGIVGVSAGAGLGAIGAIVLGGFLPLGLLAGANGLGGALVPVSAFLGAWLTTWLLYRISTSGGRTSIATMLLAGIAFAALAGALTGMLVYVADDAQLRDLTFWGLGSLAGATWGKLAVAGPIILVACCGALALSHALNALSLGEATAAHIGVPVQRIKSAAVLSIAAATGAAVAVSGGIGFVGIVVPHLLRIASGPDHGPLLVNSALLGASLLIAADTVSRTAIAPAELPIGILTALLGAPVFLWILLRQRALVDL